MRGNFKRRLERLERLQAESARRGIEELGSHSYMRDPVEFSRRAFVLSDARRQLFWLTQR